MGCKILRLVAVATTSRVDYDQLVVLDASNISCKLPKVPLITGAYMEKERRPITEDFVVDSYSLIIRIRHVTPVSYG